MRNSEELSVIYISYKCYICINIQEFSLRKQYRGLCYLYREAQDSGVPLRRGKQLSVKAQLYLSHIQHSTNRR